MGGKLSGPFVVRHKRMHMLRRELTSQVAIPNSVTRDPFPCFDRQAELASQNRAMLSVFELIYLDHALPSAT